MTIQLTDYELNCIKSILDKCPAQLDYKLFGSRAKGTAKRFSDCDIALYTPDNTPIPLSVLTDLEEQFTQSNLEFTVDLVDCTRISEEFLEHIRDHWSKF